jgi:hypothetical protein
MHQKLLKHRQGERSTNDHESDIRIYSLVEYERHSSRHTTNVLHSVHRSYELCGGIIRGAQCRVERVDLIGWTDGQSCSRVANSMQLVEQITVLLIAILKKKKP